MRYFFVSLVGTGHVSGTADIFGNLFFELENFPNNKDIKKRFIEMSPDVKDCCVTSIYEFNNEDDYNIFRK